MDERDSLGSAKPRQWQFCVRVRACVRACVQPLQVVMLTQDPSQLKGLELHKEHQFSMFLQHQSPR